MKNPKKIINIKNIFKLKRKEKTLPEKKRLHICKN
jgi:hypothetical protein